jgi:hypothetical protein
MVYPFFISVEDHSSCTASVTLSSLRGYPFFVRVKVNDSMYAILGGGEI